MLSRELAVAWAAIQVAGAALAAGVQELFHGAALAAVTGAAQAAGVAQVECINRSRLQRSDLFISKLVSRNSSVWPLVMHNLTAVATVGMLLTHQ